MTRVLVIDDEEVVRMLVVEILEAAGHEVIAAESAERALGLLEDTEFDLVVSDVVMPGLSGLELLEIVRRRHASLPIVLVTGAGTYDTLTQALTRGAAGLVTKPFAHADLRQAVAEALDRADRSREELRERLLAPTLASALANAIEARDSYLHGHCERLAALALRIAEEVTMPADEIEYLRLGAILHDVGKIGIPDRVLLKPGPLDDEERRIVETHPVIGDKLLEPLDLLAAARPIVRHHHERWDGRGYPDGLSSVEIPIAARIVAVADSVEVMSSRQLYRAPLSPDQVVAELQRQSGKQWDGDFVAIVLALIESGELELRVEGLRLTVTPGIGGRPMTTSCLIADDHPALTWTLAEYLTGNGFKVVGPVGDGRQAVAIASSDHPELALVDFRMPHLWGLDLIAALRETSPTTRLCIYTADADASLARDVLEAGASALVLKEAPLQTLVRALRTAEAGGTYIDPTLAAALPSGTRLTERELDVLRLLAEGLRQDEIGRRLGIGPETVRTHLRKACQRLGAATRTQAVAAALRQGLIA